MLTVYVEDDLQVAEGSKIILLLLDVIDAEEIPGPDGAVALEQLPKGDGVSVLRILPRLGRMPADIDVALEQDVPLRAIRDVGSDVALSKHDSHIELPASTYIHSLYLFH